MKKILFVINTMGRAGAETALLTLLRKLDPRLYDISLYVLLDQGELITEVPDYVKVLNHRYSTNCVLTKAGESDLKKTVLLRALKHANVIRSIPYISSNLSHMIRRHRILPEKLLWRVVANEATRFEETYDLAVAYLEGGATYYVADYVKAKKKAAFVHIDYHLAGYDRALDRGCYDSFHQIFTVSDEVKTNFLKVYPEYQQKVKVFHNIIDTEYILSRAQQPIDKKDYFTGIRLLTIGRLTTQKAYDIAIEAMTLLHRNDIRWYVIGEGNQREYLENKIKEAGLEANFILLGQKENPYPYYLQTDIYVHATRYEGKSIAIQEAQTLGCAILASDCSGNREQIQDGVDGMLCELSPDKIAEAITWLIDHPNIREAYQKEAVRKSVNYEEELELLDNLMK